MYGSPSPDILLRAFRNLILALCAWPLLAAGCAGVKPLTAQPPPPPSGPPPAGSILLVLPNVMARAGEEFDLPVRLEEASNFGSLSIDFTFSEPTPGAPVPLLLDAAPVIQGFTPPVPGGGQVVTDNNPDLARVGIYIVAERGLTGAGTLLRARFRLPAGAAPGTVYQVSVRNAAATDATIGNPRPLLVRVTPGSVTVQ